MTPNPASSANINVRSMHGDASWGLPSPIRIWRGRCGEELWGLHAYEVAATTKDNFELWNQTMDKNWNSSGNDEPLTSHLLRFWDVIPYSPSFTVD